MDAEKIINSNQESDDALLYHTFLTVDEAAAFLRTNSRLIRRLIYGGRLQATKLSYRVTIIKKEALMMMLEASSYKKRGGSIYGKKKSHKKERKEEVILSKRKGKEKPTLVEETCATVQVQNENINLSTEQDIPKSKPKRSVKTTLSEQQYKEDQLYTMAEICHKYGYTYARFYDVRIRYEIPCVKANGTKCFPKADVDLAMTMEINRVGKVQKEYWYSCADIMRIYGISKTQVRRFAQTHKIRTKRCGKNNRYLKSDWEKAREKAEETYSSMKPRDE